MVEFEKPQDMEQETWERLHKTDAEHAATEGYALFPTDSRGGHKARAMFGLAALHNHGWAGFAVVDSLGGLDVRATEKAMETYESEEFGDSGIYPQAGIRPAYEHETGTGRLRWAIRDRCQGGEIVSVLNIQVCRRPEVLLPRRVNGSVIVIELEILLDGTDKIESLYVDEGLAEGRHFLVANDAMVAATGHPAPEAIFLAATRERFDWILGYVEAGDAGGSGGPRGPAALAELLGLGDEAVDAWAAEELTAVLSNVEDHLDYLTDGQRQRFEHAVRVLKEK